MELFAGVELDVVSQGDGLFVYHPPAENLGLRLREYFRVAARRPGLHFWLDVKEPGPGVTLARALAELDVEFGLRPRAIVELPPDHRGGELARTLAGQGWRVSHYLPTEDHSAAHPPRADEAARFVSEERDYALVWGFSYVSYDVGARKLARALAEGARERGGMGRLTWDLAWDPSRADFATGGRDADEAVILVPFHSRYEN